MEPRIPFSKYSLDALRAMYALERHLKNMEPLDNFDARRARRISAGKESVGVVKLSGIADIRLQSRCCCVNENPHP